MARLAVEGDVQLVALIHLRLHAHERRSRNDDRPVGEHVRRDRRQHDRVDDRLDDRSAGREVVRGGSRRRRHDQAVRFHPRDELVADRHGQVGHPRARRFRDDDVVQREMLRQHRARAHRRRPQHHALLHPRATTERRIERRVQLGERRLGEESEAAEVDPEDGHIHARGARAIGNRQERPVASEHDHQIDQGDQRRFVHHLARRPGGHQRGRRGLEQWIEAAILQPRLDLGEVRHRLTQMRPGDDPDACHGDIVQRS